MKIDMEKICEKVHAAYCYNYLMRNGKPHWTNGDYDKLNEEAKEVNRGNVLAVLKEITLQSLYEWDGKVEIDWSKYNDKK